MTSQVLNGLPRLDDEELSDSRPADTNDGVEQRLDPLSSRDTNVPGTNPVEELAEAPIQDVPVENQTETGSMENVVDSQNREDNDDDNDSVSTPSEEFDRDLEELAYPVKIRDASLQDYRDKGKKRSKASAIYIGTLEDRVAWLEKSISRLLESGNKGNKEEPSDEVSLPPPPKIPSACILPKVLDINRMDLGKWTSYRVRKLPKDYGTCVVDVAYVDYNIARQNDQNLLNISEKEDRVTAKMLEPTAKHMDENGLPATRASPIDRSLGSLAVPARLAFNSPWPSIVLEMLSSGLEIPSNASWIRPFKHFVVYEKQIRDFVATLEKDTSLATPGSMIEAHLCETMRKSLQHLTITSTGSDLDVTESDVSSILARKAAMDDHFQRRRLFASAQEDTASESANASTDQSGGAEPHKLGCTCFQDALNHLQLLIKFMDEDLSELFKLRQTITNGTLQKIAFEHLWHLYQPGDIVVSTGSNCQAYRILHVSGGRPLMNRETSDIPSLDIRQSGSTPFVIDCFHLDFDGTKFGPVQKKIQIVEYKQEKEIKRLEVYPLRFAERWEELKSGLLSRGRQFVDLAAVKHKRYSGLSVGDSQEIDSEVIIDFELAFRQTDNAQWKPKIGLKETTVGNVSECFEPNCGKFDCTNQEHNAFCDDMKLDEKLTNDFLRTDAYQDLLREVSIQDQLFSDSHFLLFPSLVYGFILRTRKWVCLDINLIREVETESPGSKQKEAFDDLVIPDDYKRVVKSLVTNHSRGSTPIRSRIDERQQVDLIQGKGKGLFILLHGVPGVGKTSTAESVAAYTKRPLLPITCGDIGQTAEDVEERLEALFLLARKWGCVLLLDEADVFLARRERGDVARNALVSVFLRVLDYYTGILFLTTNRVGAMDEAFKARMHISLYYPKLSEESTMDIWKMNLTRLERSGRDIDFNPKKIVRFAQKHWETNNQWNGRQIRNAFSTAIALAEYDFHAECKECQEKKKEPPPRPVLLKEHFKAVAQASAEFDNYLASVLGEESYSGKARLAEIRDDEWEDRGKKTAYGKSYQTPETAARPPHLSNGALTTATPTPASGRATRKTSIVDTRQAENKRLDELRQKKVEREREAKEKEKREAAAREAADLAELAELEKKVGERKADTEEDKDDSDEDS